MQISNALATVAVNDLKASRDWYDAVFARAHDSAPMDGLFEWRFPAGGWIQLYEKAEHAGHCSVTLVVDDIAACRDDLKAAGHTDLRNMDGDTTRLTILQDPDGNQIVFAQSLDAAGNPSTA